MELAIEQVESSIFGQELVESEETESWTDMVVEVQLSTNPGQADTKKFLAAAARFFAVGVVCLWSFKISGETYRVDGME